MFIPDVLVTTDGVHHSYGRLPALVCRVLRSSNGHGIPNFCAMPICITAVLMPFGKATVAFGKKCSAWFRKKLEEPRGQQLRQVFSFI